MDLRPILSGRSHGIYFRDRDANHGGITGSRVRDRVRISLANSDTTSQMIARLNAPIVLAHGLFGFSRIGLGPLTLTTYFRGIPDHLRAAGNRVLVTRVHPIAGVEFRAQRLGDRILRPSPTSRCTSSATAWEAWMPGACSPTRSGGSGCSA